MPDTSTPNWSDRLKTAIAVTIAVTSVIGALIAGGAARLSSAAGDASLAGFVAAVNEQQADVVARTSLFRELRAYADRRQFLALADALEADAAVAESAGDAVTAENLRAQAEQHRVAARAAEWFISPAYMDDAGYQEDLFLQDQRLFAQRNRDLNPEDDYARARNNRLRSEGLINALVGLSLSVLLFTVAEQSGQRWRMLFFAFGLTILACGLCSMLWADVLRALSLGS